ncbi:MAG TPA: serine--tRNA ligase [Candidatus Magasanikbacteria bacterium]|uniref:Serine--tRNA ligase n=1 Tax=Candidatus Magasanikbacteria bacterium GW2011_GWC2_41_17 TaxID=1619048 RepID=A0A0G0YH58_9BACT|nr:MAG: Serine-tRNA ligase [Candidatus Magasanikbacteria bacterium GW2011_GWC2_41_17]HBV58193.1 serine--tRNA ligase [Candidatus Magasanikbacteria bacterium]HBX15866.1 serine--tRNA ligase [Candidatus Magasanikbacteria bacterium]
MLDIKFIKENLNLVDKNNASRNVRIDLKKLVDLDEQRKTLQAETEGLRNERKKISKTKPTDVEIIEMRKLGDKLQQMEDNLRPLENQIAEIICQIPNLNHTSTPIGKNEMENKVIETVGDIPEFSFEPKQHFDVEATKDLIDCESGAKVSGSRFYYLKGKLALLERAIIEYGLQNAVKRGFELILPPILVRERAMFGTGFFPADKNEIYKVNPGEDDLYLIGTAEVPLITMHDGHVFNKKDLPKKYCAITPCFRREAGSYGKDQSGILRVHQFYKVEMVVFSEQEKSWEMHEEILAIEKELFNDFGLPYQVVNICSGDLGFPAAKKYDLEAWLPGQKQYREMTSASNTTDFQSRRLNIKYKKIIDNKEVNALAHTLNGTMVTDRALIAIIENYQQEDGHIVIPKVLQKLTGFEKI